MAPITRNSGVAQSQPSSNQSHQGNAENMTSAQPTAQPGGSKKRKKVRGPTFMCKVWGLPEDERIPVSFNEKGQPISNTSVFNHFLGSVARNGKFAPLHYPSWHRMPEIYKNDMMALAMQKFNVSPGDKVWILRSISKKWRSWKSRVKEHFNLEVPIEEQMRLVPDRVQADQWRELVKFWHIDKVKNLSEKNKDRRAGQTIIYRMGKIPLAVVREEKKKDLGHDPSRADMFLTCFTKNDAVSNEKLAEKVVIMREKVDQLPEGEHYSAGPNDIFAQVMGAEKPGSVRTFGLGVCPSDVWGTTPSRGSSYRMAMGWKTELEKTNHDLQELRAIVMEQRGQNGVNPSNVGVTSSNQQYGTNVNPSNDIGVTSSNQQHGTNGVNPSNVGVTSPNQHISSSSQTSQCRRIKRGDTVSLRSMADRNEVVGKGRVMSMDPSAVVNGVELGINWCEVHVLVPIKWDECLIRPYGLLKTVGDAIGTPIAWPLSLVMMDEDD